ncbi:unnamed protein product [Rotaria sp. Silwood2]|nr:unnamed protein product [Rotaria sp. Silwood2]CAF4064853.1 unnamed protein product [Rotaria sp. Silwood2]
MIKPSHLSTKTTISSVLGNNYTEPANEEEKQLRNGGVLHDVGRMYERSHDIYDKLMSYEYSSDEEFQKENRQITFSSFCEKVRRKKDLPTPLFAVFANARQKVEDPIGRYFAESNLYKVWSFLTLPITLPIDLTYTTMKRIFGKILPSSSFNQSSNRAMNFFWSFFSDNDDYYCYHVNDCECTESRISSNKYNLHYSYARAYQRQISAPTSSRTSSSNESNDEDFLTVNNHNIEQLNQSTMNKDYCHYLQQMAELSSQQKFNEKFIKFFSDDHHLTKHQTHKMPATSLGRTLLFT